MHAARRLGVESVENASNVVLRGTVPHASAVESPLEHLEHVAARKHRPKCAVAELSGGHAHCERAPVPQAF
jgi:hypothetical protein